MNRKFIYIGKLSGLLNCITYSRWFGSTDYREVSDPNDEREISAFLIYFKEKLTVAVGNQHQINTLHYSASQK